MTAPRPSKTHIGNHKLHPETLMLGYGYDPLLSEGAVKPPVFLTSTFVFKSAEEGRDFFDYTAGRRQPPKGSAAGLVYSRFNHPNSEIVEERLAVYEEAEACILFSSGMSAIATTTLAFARPGDVVVHSQPLYGGTETLLSRTLKPLGIDAVGFANGVDEGNVREAVSRAQAMGRIALFLIENSFKPTQYTRRHSSSEAHRRRGLGAASAQGHHHLRQHALGTSLPEAAGTGGGYLGVLAYKVCRRTLRSDRRGSAGERSAHKASEALAGRNWHAARSTFVLDAWPLARDA